MISSLDVIMLEATPVRAWRDGLIFLIPSKVQISTIKASFEISI